MVRRLLLLLALTALPRTGAADAGADKRAFKRVSEILRVGSDRFRVHGGLRCYGNRACMVLEMEFLRYFGGIGSTFAGESNAFATATIGVATGRYVTDYNVASFLGGFAASMNGNRDLAAIMVHSMLNDHVGSIPLSVVTGAMRHAESWRGWKKPPPTKKRPYRRAAMHASFQRVHRAFREGARKVETSGGQCERPTMSCIMFTQLMLRHFSGFDDPLKHYAAAVQSVARGKGVTQANVLRMLRANDSPTDVITLHGMLAAEVGSISLLDVDRAAAYASTLQ